MQFSDVIALLQQLQSEADRRRKCYQYIDAQLRDL